MATFSTADDPLTRPDDWPEAQSEPAPARPDQDVSDLIPRPLATRIRDELWQPRYAVVAAIVIILIALQLWILF
jgi:hypothetical protein